MDPPTTYHVANRQQVQCPPRAAESRGPPLYDARLSSRSYQHSHRDINIVRSVLCEKNRPSWRTRTRWPSTGRRSNRSVTVAFQSYHNSYPYPSSQSCETGVVDGEDVCMLLDPVACTSDPCSCRRPTCMSKSSIFDLSLSSSCRQCFSFSQKSFFRHCVFKRCSNAIYTSIALSVCHNYDTCQQSLIESDLSFLNKMRYL